MTDFTLKKFINDTVELLAYRDKLIDCSKHRNTIHASFQSGMKVKIHFEIINLDDNEQELEI